MIDIAKIVDIVLLMIDGKYGFEMETMEFLNVLSSSGMPGNVFGILTKLDLFKKQDTLRTQKKRLKHRFWSELYQGAKLFYLSGVVNGRYPDREILNLSRFISVMKNPRPLIWRNSHPYCLADRYLDITPPTEIEKNPKCDRTVALYGYLRGTNFPAQGARVHIPGVGDLGVSDIEALPDPCPTPFMDQAMQKQSGKASRRRLGDKQKVLFAPMSDVGGVLVDKDAVYIDVKTSTFDPTVDLEERGLGEQLVMGLQGDRRLLGHDDVGVRLFGNGGVMRKIAEEPSSERRPMAFNEDDVDEFADDIDTDEDEAYHSGNIDDDDEGFDKDDLDPAPEPGGQPALSRKSIKNRMEEGENEEYAFADSDSDIGSLSSANPEDYDDLDEEDDFSGDDDDEDGQLRWKSNLADRAKELAGGKVYGRIADLARLMYDLTVTPAEAINKWKGASVEAEDVPQTNGDHEDDFFSKRKGTKDDYETEERMIPKYNYDELENKWQDSQNLEAMRGRFASARPSKGEGDEEGSNDESGFGDSDDEGDGEFEDLEAEETTTGETNTDPEASLEAEREKNAKRKEELKLRFEEEDREGFANDKANSRREGGEDEFGEDDWYDAQKAGIQKQLDINRAEFGEMDEQSRIRVEGHKAGTYARIVLDKVPYEFCAHFNPRYPVIIGGLSPTEERFGFVQVRIKRHRWHQKILKTNDPLIFSLGWRRFQTLPVYSISDSRTRNRLLKYTPEHMHCFGTFYGPLIAPNTGFCCVQSFSNKNAGFRVAATGVVLNVDESTEIVKKLKLKGVPHKIYKNTAIIKNMFGSDLEIMKFKAGNLKTVSGVRGMIKGRAGSKYPDGYARAGFEDKILMSDIVFLSTWRQIKPQEFYTPVTNLLVAPGQIEGEDGIWQGMRLTGQVRRDQGIPTPMDKNSAYRPIERATRHFNPLRVPRKLQADLPFKSQIVQMKPQRKETYIQKRAVVLGGEEKCARDLMQKLTTLRNEKVAKRQLAQEKRREPYKRKLAEGLEKKAEREKREKSEYWKREGKKRKNTEDGDGSSKRRR